MILAGSTSGIDFLKWLVSELKFVTQDIKLTTQLVWTQKAVQHFEEENPETAVF